MGTRAICPVDDPEVLRTYTRRLLSDVRALDRMIQEGMIETGVTRLGAEQEVFLLDDAWHAAPIGPQVMTEPPDERLTTEYGAFNLEINADPFPMGGDCLRQLEQHLFEVLGRLKARTATLDAHVLLCGILPTLRPRDLDLSNMTPEERYTTLDRALGELRGGDYRIYMKGVDELLVRHGSTMLEACNTSFQLHLQVAPDEFARMFNASLVAVGPVLAAATNSPLLFGRRLWRESRIALFQQSLDTRRAGAAGRAFTPRVYFGREWAEDSPVELFRDDIARFRVLLATMEDEEADALGILDEGGVPKLPALQTFNSTVYRWVRPCYGTSSSGPHLRIENRVLPAGPTLTDEIANAAFWYGLVRGLAGKADHIGDLIQFDDAQSNFVSAARLGLGAPVRWLEGRRTEVGRLILDELIEVAANGLDHLGVDVRDRDHYLSIIEKRVEKEMTGADWALWAYETLDAPNRGIAAMRDLVERTHDHQQSGEPVHEWPRPRQVHPSGPVIPEHVDELMSTDLLTVQVDDPIELAMSLMRWRHVRHIPVENGDRELVGLVTRGDLFRWLDDEHTDQDRPISDVMCTDLVTVPPHTSVAQALEVLDGQGLSALPVVREKRLVGLVTERDFLRVASQMADARGTPPDDPIVPARSW